MALNLDIAEWLTIQTQIHGGTLGRLQLAELLQNQTEGESRLPVSVRVWRNYAVEPMEPSLMVCGLYWNLEYRCAYTGYDDSFTFVELNTNSDSPSVELILVDTSHYKLSESEFEIWFSERISCLREISGNPVISVVLGETIKIGCNQKLVNEIAPLENESFYDSRYERTTGSRLTPKTHSLVAREVGNSWIASVVLPPKKLIAVDLDFTLHEGILGEVGPNVLVNEDFVELQEELLAAKDRGYMLAIISKNERQDVIDLLNSNSSYRLSEKDFVMIEASWNSKESAMERILQQTRINQDAVIFVDDNPIELIQMHAAFPKVALVSAADGPITALQTLRLVPGYRRAETDNLGSTRIQDIQSNEAREALMGNGLQTYYQSAKPILAISLNDESQLERLVDLGKRSNQFNLTLKRSTQNDYELSDSSWVGLSLRDRFSDSGVIGGLLVTKVSDRKSSINELFLSCRVLGRGLETALICQGILSVVDTNQTSEVEISWVIAERNDPALSWLSKTFLGEMPNESGSITISQEQLRELATPPMGVEIEVTK